MKQPCLTIPTLLALSAIACAEPAQPDGTVTLPFSSVKQMLDLQRKLEAPLPDSYPLPAVLESAEYELIPDKESAILSATFTVRTLAPGWHVVPCASASLALESVEPLETTLVVKDTSLAVLLRDESRQKATLRFRLAGTAERDLVIPLIPAVRSSLRVASPESPPRTAEVDGQVLVLTEKPTALPPGAVQLKIGRKTPESAEPADWTVRSEALLVQSESGFAARLRTYLGASKGNRGLATIPVPGEARNLEITGDRLTKWSYSDGSRSGVHLTWDGPGRSDRDIQLEYSIPASNSDPAAALTDSVGTLILALAADCEPIGPFEPVETDASIPAWMRRDDLRLWRASKPGPWTLSIRALNTVRADDPIVTTALHRTTISAEGTLLTDSEYTIEHRRPITFRMMLPEGSRLLRCRVNGVQVSPFAGKGDGPIEIPVPAAPQNSSGKVELSYLGSTDPFDPVGGSAEIHLPASEYFTRQISWSMKLPADFVPAAVDGPFQVLRDGSQPDELKVSRQLCPANTATPANVYYERSSLK